MSVEVRATAKSIVEEVERWNAVVDDYYESGADSMDRLIERAERLLTAMENADR